MTHIIRPMAVGANLDANRAKQSPMSMPMTKRTVFKAVLVLLGCLGWQQAQAKPEIWESFFNAYPELVNTRLQDVPSQSDHCGVCHYRFTGGGTRNPYGMAVEAALEGYPKTDEGRQLAITGIENADSDGDGYSSIEEMYDRLNYSNTPTFPGLTDSNYTSTSRVDIADILPYLTPTADGDTTLPLVAVSSPNGGELLAANDTVTISYSASDASGIVSVSIELSDDNGLTWRPLADGLANTGSWSWFVPNRPGIENLIRVHAIDGAGNPGSDDSDDVFSISMLSGGYVPTTLRDMDLSGTQPLEGAILADPDADCAGCHGNYDTANEPWSTWRGSMMGQAARDPLFLACLAVAEQDAPSVGDLCIRCHSPGGWQEGRSTDTSGGQLTPRDRHGVQCDFCHRMVDFDYDPGESPAADVDVLTEISPLPMQYGNGQFINDPGSAKRGPFADVTEEGHLIIDSPFHRSADLCGTCHDVSNPVYERSGPNTYVPGNFDDEHADQDLRNMFPIERTYSEWRNSEYATSGVHAPEFAGNKPDGIVSTCQDCHMPDVSARGANVPSAPLRADLPLHDLTGGNTFIPDILPDFYPDEVDVAQLQAAKLRATSMLQRAATLGLTFDAPSLTVRVTNQTGHKLISGYPEGRRMWLNVQGFDASGARVFESGAYDSGTAVLTEDGQAKVYEIKPGLSPALAAQLGLPAGPSFHFVLNDTITFDNRIPPRGFTNAAFEEIQSAPVGYSYEDGQYWDDTSYSLPATVVSVTARLYYQTLSKEYVEFLRDENVTNSAGQDLYDAWAAHGRSQPVLMAEASALAQTAAPSINEPLVEGDTSVSGKAEADAWVDVLVDNVAAGSATADGAGNWTRTGLAALAAGQQVTARATAPGKAVSDVSIAVTVLARTSAPSVNAPIVAGATAVAGTTSEADGTNVEVHVDGLPVGSTTASGGAWVRSGLTALTAGQQVAARATAPGKVESDWSAAVTVLAMLTVGGNVSGYEGSGLVLRNNGGDDLSISGNGAFTFATSLIDGSDYAVAVSTQPHDPVQICSVSNGSGTLSGANVTNVSVSCSTETFTVGGTVSGLEGSGLVLQINGADDLSISRNGEFTFGAPLADGSAYAVSVKSQPSNPAQICTVANGTGTLDGADVTAVDISCGSPDGRIFSDGFEG